MQSNDHIVLRLVAQLEPALAAGDRTMLSTTVEELVRRRARLGGQWHSLALIAASIGEVGSFRAALDLLVEGQGGSDAAKYQKASLLAEFGEWQEAFDLLLTLPANVPDPIGNAYSRGTALLYLGRPAEARAYLEWVTQRRPQLGQPWFVLAMTADLGEEPELAAQIIAAENSLENAAPADKAPYYYALGKAHAECGDHRLAAAAFARGAQQSKTLVRYDREKDSAEAAEAVRGYSARRIAEAARRQSQPTGRTNFVTGLPRTGTTLVEQILTSHSDVGAGAESNRLALLAREVGGASFPALETYLDETDPARAARLWHHWIDEYYASKGRVVDKTLTTTRFLGLAATLLPEAPLIWLTRDPLDCAWSCFRTNFLGGAMPWSYDLSDIAFHFRLENRLLEQWREMLGDRLLVVPYESLASDPDPWIRRILAHCGLEEEPQVFAPHRSQRPVSTASMMQVRRPINRAAIGSSAPYREFLQPFVEAYGDG